MLFCSCFFCFFLFVCFFFFFLCCGFFFQAEDGIRDLVRSRGLGDVYKRQGQNLFTLTKYSGLDPEVNYRGNDNAVIGTDFFTLSLIHI